MGGIFISYRRDDSEPYVGRLGDTLSRYFGAEQVFRDRDSITPGERFPRRVEQELRSCDALLAVIGPTWLAVTDDAGQRRLDDPDDWVHLEIATVLTREDDVLVIPVLVDGASMPADADLPKPLAALAERQAHALSRETWGDQAARLTRELAKKVKPLAPSVPLHLASARAEVPAGTLPRTQQREDAVATLAKLVRLQWTEEAKIRGLFDPDPMPVQWTLTEHEVSDHRRHISAGPLILDGTSDRIDELTEQFQTLSRRRLVILGGPGSGKTTLAVQLLLRLLEVRTPAEPVPVLLTPNSWNTTIYPRMQDWLAFRLGKEYPALRAVDRDMPKELVDSGMVLPVIDGLDELHPAYRSVLLTTLNDSLEGSDPLVLTCRTDEYVDAVENADVLTAAAVIEARPLTAPAAADYLDSCVSPRRRSRWDAILVTLRRNDDTPVADVCSTPLGLWLLRSVYIENKGDPTLLIDPVRYPDAQAIKAHLFDELIPALISKRRPVRDGSDPLRPRREREPDATRRWLAYLAVQLRGERDLRWWDLASTVSPRVITMLMVLVSGLGFGLAVGLAVGLALSLAHGLQYGTYAMFVGSFPVEAALGAGAFSGLMFGPVFGLLVGWKLRHATEPGYANLRVRGRGRARDLLAGLVRWLVRGLALGLGFGLVVWLVVGLVTKDLAISTLLTGLVGGGLSFMQWGLMIGLISGLARWVRSPASNDRSRSPISTYRHSRNVMILNVLMVGMVFMLVTVPTMWLAKTSPLELLGLLGLGLGFGLVVGLVVGPSLEPAWIGLVVTSRWLAFRGKLPWRFLVFLDDAHRLGLLRTAGSVYQFRHAELQDHLAKAGETPAPATSRGGALPPPS